MERPQGVLVVLVGLIRLLCVTVAVSGITNLSLNSIDVLTGLDIVKICVAYDLDGERDHYPASLEQLKRCKPIYEELPGWSEDITGVRSLEELPENARNYVRRE